MYLMEKCPYDNETMLELTTDHSSHLICPTCDLHIKSTLSLPMNRYMATSAQ